MRSWRSRPARESRMSGRNQPARAAMKAISHEPPSSARKPKNPPRTSAQRALEPDEPLHGQAAGAPGEVEPARDRLAAAEADPGRERAARARGQPLDQPPQQRPPLARWSRTPARAASRSTGPRSSSSGTRQQRDVRQAVASAPASSGVIRRPSWSRGSAGTRRSTGSPATPSAGDAARRGGHLAHHARGRDVHQHDRGDADAGDDVGREDRRPRAPCGSRGSGPCAPRASPPSSQRAHGVAAGALLDDDRRHQHRHLARRQALLERARAPRRAAARGASPAPRRPSRPRPGRRARARTSARAGDREPGLGAVGEHPREIGQLVHERVAALRPLALDPPAQAGHDGDEPSTNATIGGVSRVSTTPAARPPASTIATKSIGVSGRRRRAQPRREPLAAARSRAAAGRAALEQRPQRAAAALARGRARRARRGGWSR